VIPLSFLSLGRRDGSSLRVFLGERVGSRAPSYWHIRGVNGDPGKAAEGPLGSEMAFQTKPSWGLFIHKSFQQGGLVPYRYIAKKAFMTCVGGRKSTLRLRA